MTEQKLKVLINVFTIIATIVIFALMLLVIFQFVNRAILNSKKNALEQELSALTTQIDNIQNDNDLLSDSSYLEQYAREYYGYGKNGEKQYSTDIEE